MCYIGRWTFQHTPQLPRSTIHSQKRLALLVEEYRQPNAQYWKDPIWDLVHHALQAMVNLKRFFVDASHGHPPVELSRECIFQPEFLQWYRGIGDEELEPEFLDLQVPCFSVQLARSRRQVLKHFNSNPSLHMPQTLNSTWR